MSWMPKVYISAAADFNLSSSDLSIKKELLKRVADENFDVQEFQGSGIPKGMRWSFEDAGRIMDRCQGVLVLAQGRFTQHFNDMKGLGASEYCHYEGGLAIARGLPLLVLVGADVLPRGIAWTQGPHLSIPLLISKKTPQNAGAALGMLGSPPQLSGAADSVSSD